MTVYPSRFLFGLILMFVFGTQQQTFASEPDHYDVVIKGTGLSSAWEDGAFFFQNTSGI